MKEITPQLSDKLPWTAVVVLSPGRKFFPVKFVGQWDEVPYVETLEAWNYWKSLFENIPSVRSNPYFQHIARFAQNNLPRVYSAQFPTKKHAIIGLNQELLPAVQATYEMERAQQGDERHGNHVMSLTTGKVYPSARAAARAVNGDHKNILRAAARGGATAYDQEWAEVDPDTRKLIPPETSYERELADNTLLAGWLSLPREDQLRVAKDYLRDVAENLDPASFSPARYFEPPNQYSIDKEGMKAKAPRYGRGNVNYTLADLKMDLLDCIAVGEWDGEDGAVATFWRIWEIVSPIQPKWLESSWSEYQNRYKEKYGVPVVYEEVPLEHAERGAADLDPHASSD